ncbi:hypothetical protein D4764_18G0000280 [Takifugu flavidus]|uniref:Uncharacterized protein n=1 Tax=Takifugu flavidus TaxID=433684 RepID=A0A5C6NNN2_9TELE|nr:hypothetical protein D4764_18G0000280 [Takifugu flavidus]
MKVLSFSRTFSCAYSFGVFTFVKWCQIPCSQLRGPGNVDWSFCPEVVGRPVLFPTAFWSQGWALRPSMHVPGDRKRQSQRSVAAMGTVNKRSCFLSRTLCMVNSSWWTIALRRASDLSSTACHPQLSAANGSSIGIFDTSMWRGRPTLWLIFCCRCWCARYTSGWIFQPWLLTSLALKTTGMGLKLEDAVVQNSGTGRPCPIIPVTWCHRVLDMVHSLLHPVQVLVKLVGSRFVSPSLHEVKE